MTAETSVEDVDAERRFGGLRRLWGDAAYEAVRGSRIAVVGVGGVGSWAVEALARSGVAELVLFDLDHVAESNVNRQIQALSGTLGAAKVQVLAQRVAQIHPDCRVHAVEEFVEPGNWPGVLPTGVDVVIDACDAASAKFTLACWSITQGVPLVASGAAGGKCSPQLVEVADLAEVTHDPMLARLRQRVRRWMADRLVDGQPAAAPKSSGRRGTSAQRIGLTCVFSREPIAMPDASCSVDGSLNCAGYGSSVMVTASFGMAAAEQALRVVRGKVLTCGGKPSLPTFVRP